MYKYSKRLRRGINSLSMAYLYHESVVRDNHIELEEAEGFVEDIIEQAINERRDDIMIEHLSRQFDILQAMSKLSKKNSTCENENR